MHHRSLLGRLWYDVSKPLFQLAFVLLYRVRCSGRERVPAGGGVLVVCNHQSQLDPPVIGLCCPRRMSYLARASLFGFRPFAWLIYSYGAVPIDIEGSGLSGVKATLRLLKEGRVVLIFPEGARSFDGEIAPFKGGFAKLAVRAGASIQPAAIEGAFRAWPRQHRFPRRGTIHVHFGAPLMPDEIAGRGEEELVAEVEGRVRACRERLLRHPVFGGPQAGG